MNRFELLGRMMDYLQDLDDASLRKLVESLPEEITDETIKVITYGNDDTEHMEHSPVNAADLIKAMEELKDLDFVMPEHVS
ncbi:MAG: hypothetical protein AAF267_24025 [Deinococcota bacterium]